MMRWPVRHPVVALIVWCVLLVGIGTAAAASGGKPHDVFTLPGQQSTTAQRLLEGLQPNAPATTSVTVVWRPENGSATAPKARERMEPSLKKLAALPSVRCVTTPFARNIGDGCSSTANRPLSAIIDERVSQELRKVTHLPAGEVDQALTLIPKLAPIGSADPAQLATVAGALPSIARMAQAPRTLIDALARLTPADLAGLEGLTAHDIEAATSAFGSLGAFADLPPATLTALAHAEPERLAVIAARIPADAAAAGDALTWVADLVAPVRSQLGITDSEVRQFTALVTDLDRTGTLNPTQVADAARALPSLAVMARQNKTTLDHLARLTPHDLTALEGLTAQDIDNVTRAFGGLARFASLPIGTIDAIASANPRQLEAAAATLPDRIRVLEKDWASVRQEFIRIEAAAKATQQATSQVSADGRVAYATVTFAGSSIEASDATEVLEIIDGARSADLAVGTQSPAMDGAGAGPDNSATIGILVAIVILLLAFGSIVAAGLPIVVAGCGLAAGLMSITVVSAYMNVASFAPSLASMIGLGVGIDYALFILNRYRQGRQDGQESRDAVLAAVGTAGKAVLFAGSTVIIALLGMFVLGIDFFDGLSIAAALTVLCVMASALVFLPALLTLLKDRSLGLRLPWARRLRPFDPDASRWSSYAKLLQRKPIVPVVLALIVVGLLAWPAHTLRTGFPDDGTDAPGTAQRVGFDLMATGFGSGNSAPFLVAVRTPQKADVDGLRAAVEALEQTPGVARTLPTSQMLPLVDLDSSVFGDGGDVASVLVIATTAPQDPATGALLTRIRDTTSPAVEQAHGVQMFVGGSQAVSMDFTTVLNEKLPLFLLLVVGLGFLALMLLFHSLLIPLTAAFTSLLSFGAALGVTVSVFQLGVFDGPLGVTGTGPILPFLPIMLFAILFGLSMDYQVFLASRMQEEWHASQDNRESVRRGLAGSGRVVVIAASIMSSVFLAFVPTPIDAIKLFGVALASAVIIDAFVVRLVLVPSLMTLFGRANWWMPRWLDRLLPRVTLE